MLNLKYNEVWRKRKTLLTCYSEVHAVAKEEVLSASFFCSWVWRTLCMETGWVLIISRAFSVLDVRSWVNGRNAAIWIVITVVGFITICSPMRPIFPAMKSKTKKQKYIYAFMFNHMKLPRATTYIAFRKRVVCYHCCVAQRTVNFPPTSDRWCLHQLL